MNSETFVEQRVNYIIDLAGKFLIVENVPARVCLETGERLFAPDTVERLQQLAWQTQPPKRVVSTPVFEFA
jgi:YgiT-type zinc finger domain-containing protein